MWEGRVTKIIYRVEDFVIAQLRTAEENIIIKGSIYGLRQGDYVKVEGKEEVHKIYGKQIRVENFEKPIPSNQGAIEFLCSDLVKDVGPVRARNILKFLGPNALERIIEEGPDLLRKVPGIKKKAESIYSSILEHFELQTVIKSLSFYGLSSKEIIKAYKHFGLETVDIVKKNPYVLLKTGFDFNNIDQLALDMGIKEDSPFRVSTALIYCLKKASQKGHCYLPRKKLISSAVSFLNSLRKSKVTESKIESILEASIESGNLIAEKDNIYLPDFYNTELDIARKLSEFCRPAAVPGDLDKLIFSYEKRTGIFLAAKQKEAVKSLFSHGILILTGGPGTGKTETIKAVVEIYTYLFPKNKIALAAPTGRGARRLSEVTGKKAQTIHRLLGIQPGQKPGYNKNNPLPHNLLIIDEASMLDIFLARNLFRAVNSSTRVLIAGDKDQLPPVGPGYVLRDLLNTEIPAVHLTEIFRQAAQSQIIYNAHRVHRGEPIEIDPSKNDFYYIKQRNPVKVAALVKKAVKRLLEKGYSMDDIQVLSPMRKTETGVRNLNNILQETFKHPNAKEIRYGKHIFREGDKVIQLENNYEKDVYNGDIGIIEKIKPLYGNNKKPSEKEVLYVRYNGKTAAYRLDELDQIDLAYCITVHKCQGSEYKAVIMVLTEQHDNMLTRNLLYTGLTRAVEFFCLIGPESALEKAIKNNKVIQRNTGLAQKLTMYLKNKDFSHEKTVVREKA